MTSVPNLVNATFLTLLSVLFLGSTVRVWSDPTAPSAQRDGKGAMGSDPKTEFEAKATKLRESAILALEPPGANPHPDFSRFQKYPWKTNIVTTVFWVGRDAKGGDGQTASAWDPEWVRSFGGFDDPLPAHRKDFIPVKFVPRQNPFYVALPYNDVAGEKTKPEAKSVIPWFKEAFVKEGTSVCRNRWVGIRASSGKVCYAQWSDCGPYQTDHFQYVFGTEKPRPNANQGTGLNVSPAVRDFLGLENTDVTDWRFAECREVPNGPWSKYGENNPFLRTAIGPLLSSP